MTIPKRILLLSSCALAFFSKEYAPESPFTQGTFAKTIAALFAIQYFAQAFYKVLIYPFFLSPLRHLPQPSVCLPLLPPLAFKSYPSKSQTNYIPITC